MLAADTAVAAKVMLINLIGWTAATAETYAGIGPAGILGNAASAACKQS